MPYIKQERRKALDTEIDQLFLKVKYTDWSNEEKNTFDKLKGEYNYIFYTLILKAIQEYGVNYSNLQDMIGTLECCKQELYRKEIIDYENIKEKENGPINV